MSKKTKAADGLLAGFNAGHAQHAIDSKLASDADRGRSLALLPVDSIRPREADTRPAKAADVLTLAESIAAVGLVAPVAVDRSRRLVAGLHRWNACRLLMAPAGDRAGILADLEGAAKVDDGKKRLAALPKPEELPEPLRGRMLPCRVLMDLDAAADPDAALAAEAAENTARKQYTPAEVKALAERLRAAGYRETGGRPRKGEKALRPALGLVLGISPTTARRMLGKRSFEKHSQVTTFPAVLLKLARALDELAGMDIPAGTRAPALRKAMEAADTLAALLPDAITEAQTLEIQSPKPRQ